MQFLHTNKEGMPSSAHSWWAQITPHERAEITPLAINEQHTGLHHVHLMNQKELWTIGDTNVLFINCLQNIASGALIAYRNHTKS